MTRSSFSRALFLAAIAVFLLPTPSVAQRSGRAAQRAGGEPPTAARSDDTVGVRRPRGISVVVVLDESRAKKDSDDLDALAANPAVSGLAVRMFWSSLQPAKDRYDFSKLDAAFAIAAARHKTVQLILVPGFGTPAWVLDEIPSCDDVLPPPSAPAEGRGEHAGGGHAAHAGGGKGEHGAGRADASRADAGRADTAGADGNKCGKALFAVSEGKAHGQKQELPLPWNPIYKNYWKAFLTEVASRYESHAEFVSIAVTGPTAESAEIIVPRAGDQLERWAQLLEIAYRDPSYHRSDKAFVEEWDAAVTVFGEVFHDVTIVLTRGSGLPDFTHGQGSAAQTAIVTAFGHHAVGTNSKATQTSGMKACRETEAGIEGVKEMSANASLSPRVLGGAQFDTSFSEKPAAEGCSASCSASAPVCASVTPSLALSNVLSVYFDDTPAGDLYHSKKGAAPMNYMQVYAPDIRFANTQPAIQTTLDQASQRILTQAK